MPKDNLTLKLKEQLASQGFAATDQEIDNYLKSIKLPSDPQSSISRSNQFTSGMPDWLTGPEKSESKINLLEGIGATVWNAFDTALFSVPGIIARKTDTDEILGLKLDPEERGPAGKVGGVIGEAAGFLVPMKWVSKGVSYGVKSLGKMGGKRILDDVIQGTGHFKETGGILDKGQELGFSDRNALEKVLSKTFKSSDEGIRRGIASYGVSGEAIRETKDLLRTRIGENLSEAFPDMEIGAIEELAKAITVRLGTQGLHINSVGRWIQSALGRTVGIEDASKISKYVAHAGEMTTNFALYNILTDGIQSIAGEREFDPVQDAYDALVFSAFLPFVEMLPGGGKVPIASTSRRILEYMNKYKKFNYKNLADDELNGLLQIISSTNAMKNAPFMEEAFRNSSGMVNREAAIGALEKIRKMGNIDGIWRSFAKEAGSDLARSTWRMMAGAAYFNSHTLLDPEMVRNVDPEVLGAHMLVGAFFTRMRKPIFENPSPYMTDFQSKVELLRQFGIDASNLKASNSYYTKRNMLAGAQAGSMTDSRVKRIYDIIYDAEVMNQVDKRANIKDYQEIGERINDPEFNIIRMAQPLADIRRFNELVKEGKPDNYLELTQITPKQAETMKQRLEEIIINKEKDWESRGKIKLTEENFDDYYLEITKDLQLNGGKSIVNRLMNIAKELGISTDGDASAFDFDVQNIRIADIEGTSTSTEMQSIVTYQKILNRFKKNGTIGSFEPFQGRNYEQLERLSDLTKKEEYVNNQLKEMVADLKRSNFPEGTEVHINPADNAWLDLMDSRQSQRTLSTIYDVIRGRGLDKPGVGNEIKSLYRSTRSVLGNDLPPEKLIGEVVTIDRTKKPEAMTEKVWNELLVDKIGSVEKDLQDIARIWSQHSQNRSPNYNRDKQILWEDAKLLVDIYKNQYPRVFEHGFLDKLNSWHTHREYKDLQLGNMESGILSLASVYNVIQKSENGLDWTMMDRRGFEDYLNARIKSGELGGKEKPELLAQFDKIRESLSRIDGKYLKFVNELETRGPNESDMIGFVKEAYGITRESVNSVLTSYENVMHKIKPQAEQLQRGNAIIEKLYDTETENIRKLSLEDTMELSLDIKNLIGRAKASKDKSSYDKQFYSYFERLQKMIEKWQNGKMIEPFSSTERNYIDGNDLIIGRSNKLSDLNKQIIRMTLLSNNTLWGKRNAVRMKDEIIAKLTNQLGKIEIDLGKQRSLEEIYDWYNLGDVKPERKIDAFIKEIKTRAYAFERNMSPNQYELLRQEVARNREIYETDFDKTPKETYQSVENKYGQFNENLRGDKYQTLKENIIISIAEGTGTRKAATDLLDQIHIAIDAMNYVNEPRPLNRKQMRDIRNQKIQFNKRFPGLLAQSFGTESVKHISFSENGAIKDKDKVELIIESKTESAGGNSSFHRLLFEQTGAESYNVGKNAVWGNQSYSDFSEVPLKPSEKNELFEKPSRVKEESTDTTLKGFRGIKITVSKWDQIYLRTDNFRTVDAQNVEGGISRRFKDRFNTWYDDIMSKLPDAQSRNNFKKMYEEFRKMDEITLPGPLREIIKAQYWSHLSEAGFIDMIKAADRRTEMNAIGIDLMKYLHYMRTGGAQIKGSESFLNTISDMGRQQIRENGFWWDTRNNIDNWAEIQQAIIDYKRKPNGFEVLSIKEDSKTGGLSAHAITKNQLQTRLNEAERGTNNYKALKELIAELEKSERGESSRFDSILASAVDAQSWLGTTAAHIAYLHRGRTIYDDLAGVKPTGWSNANDILLKTNFIYDRNLADLLDRAGIDILTTETAAKRFGAGHTELMVQGATGMRPIEARDYTNYVDAFTKAEESLTNGIKSNLRIEDLYFGKTTDRHMVNVSYATTNFLSNIGYGKFTKHLDYYNQIENGIGRITEVNNPKVAERNHKFMEYLRMAKEEGDIFTDGTSGSLERLIREGVDVQADWLMPDVQKIITRKILGEITKPKTPWGSHSVLIPYLEGSAPLYAKIGKDKKDVQIAYGGKKLSYYDGLIEIGNVKELKFIAEHTNRDYTLDANNNRIKSKGYGRKYDIQIGFNDKGNVIVNHPTRGEKIDPSLKQAIQRRLSVVEDIIKRNNGEPTMKNVHDILMTLNNTASKVSHGGSYSDLKMFIHSLSLRVPNIGGDVAVHKIEGFYEREIGNVVGINPMDLSVKHQGDFDVDMAHSYHRLPWKVAESITDNLAKTPDAKVYPSFDKDLDLFNMGTGETHKVQTVGRNENLDSLERHYNNYRNAQKIFGSIMNIAPGIAAMERLGFKLDGKEAMMKMESSEFIPVKQRLKNVLQSIIDSTKTDNFASLGSREEVLKFVLFGRDFNGSETRYRLSEYGESGINEGGWEGMFKFPESIKGNQKIIVEDAIIKMLSILNSSNRVLSGVTNESGRRPPDLRQMMAIRSKIERFLKEPGQVLFNDLLFDYRVLNKETKSDLTTDLLDLFYNIKDFNPNQQKKLREELFSKKMMNPVITNTELFRIDRETSKKETERADGEKLIHKIGVGGIILDMFGTHLHDKSKMVKHAVSTESKQAYNLLDKIEATFMLSSPENIAALVSENKSRKEFLDLLDTKDTYQDFADVLSKDLTNYNIGKIQKYSILNHIVDKESRGLRSFINSNKSNKFKTDSLVRAQFKLKTLDIVKDHLLDKEREFIDSNKNDPNSAAYKYFKFKDWDLSKSKSGMQVYNRDPVYKYIYRLGKQRDGRFTYSFYGTLSPSAYGRSGKKFLRKGSKYVIMDNPIRYEMMSTKEVKDAYALLEVVGEAVASNIKGKPEAGIDSFYDRLGNLRKDMYELSAETFKMSKKSAFAQRNWSDAAKHENILLERFFEQTRKDMGQTELSPEAVHTIASILIKPRQVSDMVKLSNESPILLPAFKINKRMIKAVERFLHAGGEKYRDVYTSIFKAYGAAYRRKNDRIIDTAEEYMYRSDMYQNGPLYVSRDPALDLAMGTYGYMYIPSILQSVRGELRGYGGRAYKTYDSYGNVRRMINYDNLGNHELLGEYYSTDKWQKDAVETRERCD